MKLKLAILSAFVLQGAQAAPSINLRVFGGLAHTSVKVEHDYPVAAAAVKAEGEKAVEAAKPEADAKGKEKAEDKKEKAADKAVDKKNEKSESAFGATGGFAVDLSVQKEAMFFGLTGGMHYLAATPTVTDKFKAEHEALTKFAGFDAAVKANHEAEGEEAKKPSKAAAVEAGSALLLAFGDEAEVKKFNDAENVEGKYEALRVLHLNKEGKRGSEGQAILDKAAKETKDADWSVTADHGPMYFIGVHGGMNFTDKLSAALTVAPAFRNFKYEIKQAATSTASETGIEVGVLGALRATYKLTDMFSVFGEVGYAMFFSEGKLASSKAEKKADKKPEGEKEAAEAAKKTTEKEAKAKEGADDASKTAAAHKIKTHVPGNVFFATAGVSVKLM